MLYPFIQYCSLLVPWLPLFDEFLLRWTSSVHSQAHTLEQSFSELCMQLTCESCSNDSYSIGLRGRALGLLISAISQVMLMHWYTDRPLGSKTLGLIITSTVPLSKFLKISFWLQSPTFFCVQNRFFELKLPYCLTPLLHLVQQSSEWSNSEWKDETCRHSIIQPEVPKWATGTGCLPLRGSLEL